MKIELIRIAYIQYGVFGVLKENDIPFALTLERRWLDNKKGISCIPCGDYLCVRVNSPKFGNTFEVQNVPNRSEILFHKGNILDDTHGCILVGEMFDTLNQTPAILASDKGFKEFLDKTKFVDMFYFSVRNGEGKEV